MEFTLDFATIRRIAVDEREQAGRDLAELGVLGAYQRSLQRHDQRLATAADADTLACKSGCSWCCHFSVDVRPVEVFNMVQAMQRVFSPQQQQQLRVELAANSSKLADLDELQRMQQTLRCPFLMEGRCSIYAARPQTCRNYHATSAIGCQQSFEQPDNFDIAPEYAPLVYQTGGAHVETFSSVMAEAGYDVAAYELNAALTAALAEPSECWQRFVTQQPAFADTEGFAVPAELTCPDDNPDHDLSFHSNEGQC